jgi:hypothetical protein
MCSMKGDVACQVHEYLVSPSHTQWIALGSGQLHSSLDWDFGLPTKGRLTGLLLNPEWAVKQWRNRESTLQQLVLLPYHCRL